jgi:hypothetical protein
MDNVTDGRTDRGIFGPAISKIPVPNQLRIVTVSLKKLVSKYSAFG